MTKWGYRIFSFGSLVVKKDGIYLSEQEARKEAVKEMCRMFAPDKDREEPFFLQTVCFSDICPPLGLEKERYSRKETEEYGTGENLSFGELKSIAKDKYNEGGDGVYECWDQKTFDDYVQMFGPVSRKTVRHIICQKY